MGRDFEEPRPAQLGEMPALRADVIVSPCCRCKSGARNHLYRTFMAWVRPCRKAFPVTERTCPGDL
jgi:hypothetical protein